MKQASSGKVAPEAIVIGASAGGVETLSQILPALPADYPLPVMVVIHLPPDRRSVMTELFAQKCTIRVVEAEDKEPILPRTVYFAPPDYHLLVETDRRLSLSSEEPVLFSRPSIDILFETAAFAYGPALIGVVLTGASSDGANGLKAVAEAGGVTLVQAPELAIASAMPLAALASAPASSRLAPAAIADYLLQVRR